MRRRRGPARAWDPVVLSVKWWDGDEPSVGDCLETSTGRRYLITRFRLSRPFKESGMTRTRIRAFECVVLPDGEGPGRGRRVWAWEWAPRGRRA